MIQKTVFAALALVLCGAPALAWGTAGHKIINQTAMQNLPDSVPAFLRTPEAVHEVTLLGPELDRLKGSGDPHDSDEDPGHYLNAADDFTIGGVLHLDALPDSREAYDTALRKVNQDQYKLGYLPYTIIDGWEQLRKDFAYWRADDYLAQHAATPEDRAWFAYDKGLRETLTMRDLGVWAHYVGDGSQPLHVTVHYNGWGKYPNPKNYSTSDQTHAKFEGGYVRDYVNPALVTGLVGANAITDTAPKAVVAQIEGYLMGSAHAVGSLYELDLQRVFDRNTPQGVDFVQHQLARGAQELRDLIVAAYDSSATATVGYPAINLGDILGGKLTPSAKAFGGD